MEMIAEAEAEQKAVAQAQDGPAARLVQLRGIGLAFATVLGNEVFFRAFCNRREVGGYLGLAPRALSQSFGVYPALSMQAAWVPPNRRWRMILNALVEKLKRRSKDDFKGRHYEATLILQAVSWYLRYPLSYRDIEELFRERGLEVDHATLNRWVLAYAPLIERRLRVFRNPHCGWLRVDGRCFKSRGQWGSRCRARRRP